MSLISASSTVPAERLRVAFRAGSAFWRDDFLSADGAVQCVDQRLNLDEFVACSLRLVAVKRSGQHLRMRVPILDHTLTGCLQRFKSLAHLGSFAKLPSISGALISGRPRGPSARPSRKRIPFGPSHPALLIPDPDKNKCSIIPASF